VTGLSKVYIIFTPYGAYEESTNIMLSGFRSIRRILRLHSFDVIQQLRRDQSNEVGVETLKVVIDKTVVESSMKDFKNQTCVTFVLKLLKETSKLIKSCSSS